MISIPKEITNTACNINAWETIIRICKVNEIADTFVC